MNTPIRQPQQKVQQQHTPQKMQPNFQNPHIQDNTKQLPPQMQNRNVPNQQPYPNQPFVQQPQESNAQMRYPPQHGYPHKSTPGARPHSADFLEFERRHPLDPNPNSNQDLLNNEENGFRPQNNSTTPNRYAKHRIQGSQMMGNPQPPRPKSSFEHRSPKVIQEGTSYYEDNQINDVARELSNYHWSEEGYADKMRTMSVSTGGGGNEEVRQSRSRSQSRASQAHDYGGMDAGNNSSNNPHQQQQHATNYNHHNNSNRPKETIQV
jgi:hypothetical protein